MFVHDVGIDAVAVPIPRWAQTLLEELSTCRTEESHSPRGKGRQQLTDWTKMMLKWRWISTLETYVEFTIEEYLSMTLALLAGLMLWRYQFLCEPRPCLKN